MILYNVTINIEDSVHDEWLEWMKNVHIPEVMATGLFTMNNMYKVMAGDPDGTTYSVQYLCASMDDYEKYQNEFASALQKKTNDKYAGKFVAFRTLLEKV
jgi:hypothetical protein